MEAGSHRLMSSQTMTTNDTTNETLVWCTRSDNETCWNHRVALWNEAHAKQMVPVIVMMALFMGVGTLGNSIVIIMYRAKKQKTSANIFIMFLAGIDLFACVAIHPYIIYKIYFFYNQTWAVACKIFEFLLHFNLMLSSLTLMLIAVDRFIAICRPVKYLKFDRHIMKAVAITCFLSFITSVPILEFYGPSPMKLDVENRIFVGYTCHYQQSYVGSPSIAIFSGFIMIGFLVQIVAMTILYKQVAVVAYRSRRIVRPLPNVHALASSKTTLSNNDSSNHTKSSGLTTEMGETTPSSSRDHLKTTLKNTVTKAVKNGTKVNEPQDLFYVHRPMAVGDKRTTEKAKQHLTVNDQAPNVEGQSIGQLKAKRLKAAKILFLVTLVFVLSWMPFFIMRICNAATNGTCHIVSYLGEIIEAMLNHVFYINNAINPILYTIINKTFRDEFRTLLRRQFRCNS